MHCTPRIQDAGFVVALLVFVDVVVVLAIVVLVVLMFSVFVTCFW